MNKTISDNKELISGVGIVVENQCGEILSVMDHQDVPEVEWKSRGQWSIVFGKKEAPSETVLSASQRELSEESGLLLDQNKFFYLGDVYASTDNYDFHIPILKYRYPVISSRLGSDHEELFFAQEISRRNWKSVDELLAFDYTKVRCPSYEALLMSLASSYSYGRVDIATHLRRPLMIVDGKYAEDPVDTKKYLMDILSFS